jgi:hypothetical protein
MNNCNKIDIKFFFYFFIQDSTIKAQRNKSLKLIVDGNGRFCIKRYSFDLINLLLQLQGIYYYLIL